MPRLELLDCGLSQNEVANHFNCSRSTETRLDQRVRVSLFVCLFYWVYVTPIQYRSYGDVPALLVEEELRCPSMNISGTIGHLSRTDDVP
jgi:hypothetical protein